MACVNRIILLGYLAIDPSEQRITPTGRCWVDMKVATKERFYDKSTGDVRERTEWHAVQVWGVDAQNCGKFLKKGKCVYLEGRMQTRTYEKNGQRYSVKNVVATTVTFMSAEQHMLALTDAELEEPKETEAPLP